MSKKTFKITRVYKKNIDFYDNTVRYANLLLKDVLIGVLNCFSWGEYKINTRTSRGTYNFLETGVPVCV